MADMTTGTFYMRLFEGLGQLEAYIDAEEGVAFQMDNDLIWDALSRYFNFAIQGVGVKKTTSKYHVTRLPSGKVRLSDRTGEYLSVTPARSGPNAYPLRRVPSPEDASCHFDVFYRDNKIALQAYNGLLLARVYRDFHTIEAAKAVFDDESCLFRPMIGDLQVPTFKMITVISYDRSKFSCRSIVLGSEIVTNKSRNHVNYTFSVTWKATVTDKIFWSHRWGLGIANSWDVNVNGMPITLKYTEDNDRVIYVIRNIYEERQREVRIPPKSVCTAHLLVDKDEEAFFKFTATIQKVKSDGSVVTLKQPGSWSGVFYHNIYLYIEIQQFPDSCHTM